MKKADFKAKAISIKGMAASPKVTIAKPKLKTGVSPSNDGLSKSIRTKRDASAFIKELKDSLKNN